MYSAVPPPHHAENKVSRERGDETDEKNQSNQSTTIVNSNQICPPPSGVSEENWKRFQELKERRTRCCQSPTAEKRVKRMKRNVTKSVFSEMQYPDEIAALKDHGLVDPQQPKKQQRTKERRETSEERVQNKLKWKELMLYPTSNAHSSTETGQDTVDKRVLEERLESAIQQGHLDEAEELNKQLVQCDFASKIVRVVECRDYVKRKAAEEEKAKKKKKTKLHWGFEQKQRWESKGNM